MIRVFPRKTKWTPNDDLAFVGEPPLYELPSLPVWISVTFSWDIEKAKQLKKAWEKRFKQVYIGGPAIDKSNLSFVPGRFIKRGVTFTSRGCSKNCPWCLVREREGELKELFIQPGYIIQDNNLLACSRGHIEEVFDMLRHQKGAVFSGGLDIDYLEPWHVELLKSISVSEIWVACDRNEDLDRLDKAKDLLSDFSINKKHCYVLCFYNGETLDQAQRRVAEVYKKGFLPFAQPYKSPENPFGWCITDDTKLRAEFIRKWQRPAIYRSKPKTEKMELFESENEHKKSRQATAFS